MQDAQASAGRSERGRTPSEVKREQIPGTGLVRFDCRPCASRVGAALQLSRLQLIEQPGVHALFEDVERQCAAAEQFVVEGPNVESIAQRALGIFAY